MNFYNIAVTVGPNIFRPKVIKPADLINAGTFYDIMIRFMNDFDQIFGNADEKTNAVNLTFGMISPEQDEEEEKKEEPNISEGSGSNSNDMMAQCMKVMDIE